MLGVADKMPGPRIKGLTKLHGPRQCLFIFALRSCLKEKKPPRKGVTACWNEILVILF
jgi:hypothetical protein